MVELAAVLLPMQNGQPWLPALLSRFHSQMPAGERLAASELLSWQYSPVATVPGLPGSVCTVNGWRKPIAKISGRALAVPTGNRLPVGTVYVVFSAGSAPAAMVPMFGLIRRILPRRSAEFWDVLRASQRSAER